MKFYVPTIGDKIYLEQDWTFTLHRESRNQRLANRLEECGNTIVNEQMYHILRCTKNCQIRRNYTWHSNQYETWTVGAQHREAYPSERYDTIMRTGCFEFVKEDPYRWKSFQWSGEQTKVTLPRSTELTVDRIYIRGRARDYDSLTWRITACPANKKLKGARFWTKLKDANRIVCSLFPIEDKEAPVVTEEARWTAIMDQE